MKVYSREEYYAKIKKDLEQIEFYETNLIWQDYNTSKKKLLSDIKSFFDW